jgi:hypothetical protein
MANPIFVEGMRIGKPHEGAKPWIKGTLQVNVEVFLIWARQHANGNDFIDIEIKESSKPGNNWYLQLNTYQKPQAPKVEPIEAIDLPDDIKPEDLPF